MNAPLWRFALHIMLLAFAIQRGTATTMLHLSHAPTALIVSGAVATLAAVVASIAILTARFVSGALIALAVVLGADAILAAATIGQAAAVTAVIQGFIAIAVVLALRYFIQRAQRHPG